MTSIRSASPHDALALKDLAKQLGYRMSLEEIERKVSHYRADPFCTVFVAEIKSKVVGCVAVSIAELFVSGRRARIEALVVDQACRRLGVGKALMEKAEDFARSHQCHAIELTSGLHRRDSGAHAFYEKLGYSNAGDHQKLYLRKDLLPQ